MIPPKAPLLSVVLIGYNDKKFLPYCMKGLNAQTFKIFEVFYIDNASADDSALWMKKHHSHVRVVSNADNKGYVGAGNQGIKMSFAKYVMILNPDLILTPTYLERILARLEKDKKIGVITGKVLKYDFEQNRPTAQIDTTGLYCYRNRRVIDRGQGMEDKGQYDKAEEVFGVSGAVPAYRREALEDVKLPSFHKGGELEDAYEYLDEDFFMYKEDVDVSWRLRLRGWKCFYDPAALAHHGRGTGVLKRFTHWEVYKGRRHLSRKAKFYAYKNQRLMQIKNEQWGNLWRDFFPLFIKEVLIFGYILAREPYLLKSVFAFWRQLPHALKKRRLIQHRAMVSTRKMRKWLDGSARA